MLHSDHLAQTISTSARTGNVYRPLTYVEAAQLEAALLSDSNALAQVALASLFEGIAGVASSRFSWSTVKFYYSAFYAIRSMLMIKQYSIFYIGRTPHIYHARPGQAPAKKGGNSHTVAFELFKNVYRNDLCLSQDIENISPLEWIESKRNFISYRSAPYIDPVAPDQFKSMKSKLRISLVEYLNDVSNLYSFDKDHAMIAYPLLLIKRMSEDIRISSPLSEVNIDKHFVDIMVSSNCFIPEIAKSFPIFKFG